MSLTSELKDGGPIRRYFDEFLGAHKSVQKQWRASIGDVVVPMRSSGSPGNMGLAADHLLVGVAVGSLGWGAGGFDVARHVNPLAAEELRSIVEGPVPEIDQAVRASWYCGLLDSVGRGFRPIHDVALAPYRHAASLSEAFDLVPVDVVEDLRALVAANSEVLSALPGPRRKGSAFESSALVGGADGDLIAGTDIVELKTTINSGLDAMYLRQLVGYLLLDTNDEFEMTHVSLWFTRHAFIVRWPAEELLAELSGSKLSLAEHRRRLRDFLMDQPEGPRLSTAQRSQLARGGQLRLFDAVGAA